MKATGNINRFLGFQRRFVSQKAWEAVFGDLPQNKFLGVGHQRTFLLVDQFKFTDFLRWRDYGSALSLGVLRRKEGGIVGRRGYPEKALS